MWLHEAILNASPVIIAFGAALLLIVTLRWIQAGVEALWLLVLAPKEARLIPAVFGVVAILLSAITALPAVSTLVALLVAPFVGVWLANHWGSRNSGDALSQQDGTDEPRSRVGFLIARRRRELASTFEPPPTLED